MKTHIFCVLLFITSSWGLYPQERHIFEFDKGFYYMLDYPVNVRSEPNLRGSVVGQLRQHERIEIISNAGNAQKIENVWAYWYKIKFNENEGYIWGGNIAYHTLISDIDNNGINDYFYYRISDYEYVFPVINGKEDVFIYINNQRISTENISVRTRNGIKNSWMSCQFEKKDNNTVIIKMRNVAPDFEDIDIFEINNTGRIIFIENIFNEYDY
jgi:hypothetical protein